MAACAAIGALPGLEDGMRSRREILKGGGAGFLLAGSGTLWTQAPVAQFADVDPEMVDDLRLLQEMVVSADNLTAFRHRPVAQRAHPMPPLPPVATARLPVVMVPGLPGQPAVRTVQFDGAPGRKDRGAVIWLHGGGYVAGAAGIPVDLRLAAQRRGWLVVSVEYRLAPEATVAKSSADNYAALRWVHENAATLGVDRSRIAVGGASAGGGHAAMLALAARDRGEVKLAYQVLIYPMLDDRTGSSRPARPGTGQYVWTAKANRFGWSSLLGVPAGGMQVPVGVVPARRSDLGGLPPAFVGVGTLNLFLDEDLAYAGALRAAGVPVDLLVVPAAFHAFDSAAPMARASQNFTRNWIADLEKVLT
ncbi:alpha/beta hydrolase fold domain-containing protein [Sphingomonas sp. BT553]|uniref:Alpha/beta hydrolase fold domain-containing protein n=2 Tax=Sphingomonas mollis TaxID=2795726 RepID=A0ABS0XV96_9SPHN|nr:alpha/beta hydrolase fold domain-containing protein [Sphingomonas sp. BT553]